MALVQVLFTANAQESVPKYLEVARELVQNIKPENNLYHYETSARYIRFPSSGYTVHTDCTGFIEAMLDRGNGISLRFSTRLLSDRYSIIDWVDGVERGEMFDQIKTVKDMKPGDLFMWKLMPKVKASTGTVFNGHVVMIDSEPVKVEPQRAPFAEGLVQWEVWVMDSYPGPLSHDDTRYVQGANAAQADAAQLENSGKPTLKKITGVGRGRMYIFTDEAGNLRAYSNAFSKSRLALQDKDSHMIIARPRIK
ncbi:MAG: hypothetical protein H6R18_300 [Proteobacteria bacterium]|nr:hypothetical protein [Pseudomonadota bacterium]